MTVFRALLVLLVAATLATGCSDDEPSSEDPDAGDGGATTTEPADPGGGAEDDTDEPVDGADSAGATVTASDGSSWEFTETVECEIGEDGSPDYREFIGRTADGSAQLAVSYFPEAELASLSGVSIDAEVDGNDWTYADSYAGSGDAFDIALRPDGADGTAPARIVGVGAPDADLTLDWSFTC